MPTATLPKPRQALSPHNGDALLLAAQGPRIGRGHSRQASGPARCVRSASRTVKPHLHQWSRTVPEVGPTLRRAHPFHLRPLHAQFLQRVQLVLGELVPPRFGVGDPHAQLDGRRLGLSTISYFPMRNSSQLAMGTAESASSWPWGGRRCVVVPTAPGFPGRPITRRSFGLVRTVQGGRRPARSAAEGALDRPDQPHIQQSGGPSPASAEVGNYAVLKVLLMGIARPLTPLRRRP